MTGATRRKGHRRLYRRGLAVGALVLVAHTAAGMTPSSVAHRATVVRVSAAPTSSGGLAMFRGAVAGQSTTPIKHVIFILKENRSFDEYFGRFPGANGATTCKLSNGTTAAMTPTPDPMPQDIGHTNQDWTLAYDGGKMDGFDKEYNAHAKSGTNLACTEMWPNEIPNYYALASHFELGDNTFAAWKGASFANGVWLVAGQTGQFDSTIGNRVIDGNPNSYSVRHLRSWGCDDPADTTVPMRGTDGSLTESRPCFNFPSMADELSSYNVPWKFYSDNSAFDHVGLDAIQSVRNNPTMWQHVQPVSSYLSDAQNGTLPAVSWLTMPQSEHPTESSCDGENQSVQLLNALMQGPDWSSTAVVTTWDEWGGFYDHVAPPQINSISYGFRIPMLVISPYTKPGTSSGGGSIDHTLYSQDSELALISTNFNLPALDPNVASANTMMDAFDFTQSRPPLILKQRSCAPVPAPSFAGGDSD